MDATQREQRFIPRQKPKPNENTRADVFGPIATPHKAYRHVQALRVDIPTRVGVGNKYINEIRVVQWVYIYTGVTSFLLLLLPRKSEMGGVQDEDKLYG